MRMVSAVSAVTFVLIQIACFGEASEYPKESASAITSELYYGLTVRRLVDQEGPGRWEPEVIVTYTLEPGTAGGFRVLLNGEAMNAEEYYVPNAEGWRNLAVSAGLPSAHPEWLNPWSRGPLVEFGPSLFRVREAERPIAWMVLAHAEGELTGHVYRGDLDEPVPFKGTVDGGGEFAVTCPEDKALLRASGEFSASALKFRGSLSFGGKEHAVTAERLAIQVKDQQEISAAGPKGSLDFKYFVFPGWQDPWQSALNKETLKLAEGMRNEFIEQYVASLPDSYNDPVLLVQWEYTHELDEWRIITYNKQFLSAVAYAHTYTGGAHGMSFAITLNLLRGDESGEEDPTARPLELRDLLANGESAWEALQNRVYDDLVRQGAMLLPEEGAAGLNAIDLGTFTVAEEGLTFHFDPYAVGSYAEGFYHVFVPFKALDGHINHEFVNSLLTEN